MICGAVVAQARSSTFALLSWNPTSKEQYELCENDSINIDLEILNLMLLLRMHNQLVFWRGRGLEEQISLLYNLRKKFKQIAQF